MAINPNKIRQIDTLVRLCTKAFETSAEDWLNPDDGLCCFDYPDYGGLPERISGRLSGDCVDVIQEYVSNDLSGTKIFDSSRLRELLIGYLESGYDLPY